MRHKNSRDLFDLRIELLRLSSRHGTSISAVNTVPTMIDQIIATSQLSSPQVLSTISVLEMRRLLRRLNGNLVVRP